MTGPAHRAVGSCLILILIGSLITKAGYAEDGSRDRDKPIRLYATAAFGPIGSLAWNLPGSKVTINRRLADAEQAIWNGDEIETTPGANVSVLLDSVGQVTLTSGARVRLATTLTRLDDDVTRRVLIASLASGDMVVKLQQEAAAFVEACGSAYTSSRGASFRIGVRDGRALVDVINGKLKDTIVVSPDTWVYGPKHIKLKRGKSKRVRIYTLSKPGGGGGQEIIFTAGNELTDAYPTQAQAPAPFRKIHINFDPQFVTPDQTDVATGSSGDVYVTFTARNNLGPTTVTFDVDKIGDNDVTHPWPMRVTIVKGGGFWKYLSGAAAVIAVIVIVKRKGPVKLGPTTPKP
jgi:hypothetical protein